MAALQKLKETLSGKGGGWEKEKAVKGINVADYVRTVPLQPKKAPAGHRETQTSPVRWLLS